VRPFRLRHGKRWLNIEAPCSGLIIAIIRKESIIYSKIGSNIQMRRKPQKVNHVGRTPIVAANPTGTKA
jgi:hypothetical protein